jgi:TonB family protein
MNLEKLIVTAFLFVVCAPVRFCFAQTPDRVFIVGGGGTSAPVALYKVDPEYTEEAFKAKYSGTVVLQSVIGATGVARDICVVRGLGLGLDENAIESVKKWKFRPGYQNGKPVAVKATIEVNFRLLDDVVPRGRKEGESPPPPAVRCGIPTGTAEQRMETAITKQQETENPKRFENLLIEITSVTTPVPRDPLAVPQNGYYSVAVRVRIKNLGSELAICGGLNARLKAEFGLEYPSKPPVSDQPSIPRLIPGEETELAFLYMLKNGVRPVELTVEVQGYNEGCSAGGTNGIVRFVLEDISPPSPSQSKGGE